MGQKLSGITLCDYNLDAMCVDQLLLKLASVKESKAQQMENAPFEICTFHTVYPFLPVACIPLWGQGYLKHEFWVCGPKLGFLLTLNHVGRRWLAESSFCRIRKNREGRI